MHLFKGISFFLIDFRSFYEAKRERASLESKARVLEQREKNLQEQTAELVTFFFLYFVDAYITL